MQHTRPFHTSVAAEYTRHATSARPRPERAILPILLSPKRCQECMSTPLCIAMEVAKNRDCKEQTVGQPGGSPRSRTRRDRGRSSSGCCRTFPARTDSITSQGKDMANVPAPLVKLAHVPWHSIVAIERSLTLRYLSHFYDTIIAFAGLVQNRFSVFFLGKKKKKTSKWSLCPVLF